MYSALKISVSRYIGHVFALSVQRLWFGPFLVGEMCEVGAFQPSSTVNFGLCPHFLQPL